MLSSNRGDATESLTWQRRSGRLFMLEDGFLTPVRHWSHNKDGLEEIGRIAQLVRARP